MIVRNSNNVPAIEWGNGTSRRFLVADDGVGYTVTDTLVRAWTKSRLEYRNHLEACYCIEGKGEVIESDGTSHTIEPGTLYALDRNDAHILAASAGEDLRLVCVFSPALRGDERHDLESPEHSHY